MTDAGGFRQSAAAPMSGVLTVTDSQAGFRHVSGHPCGQVPELIVPFARPRN